jgi:hypothetical protein
MAATVPATLPADAITAGGYRVLAGDFHVHGFPDGLPSWDAADEARRRGLEVIALTSHNSLRGWWLWTHAPWRKEKAGDPLVLPGEELTAVGYHLAIVGLHQAIPWHQPLAAAVAAAHAQGAVAILAHPGGAVVTRVVGDDGLRLVDGVEVAHPEMEISEDARRDFARVYSRATALKRNTAAIGSSDFHYMAPIGVCRTYVFVREATSYGVLEAIRAARTVACDARGLTYGPPELAPLVAERCRADAERPPADTGPRSRIATLLVWGGLLGLVLAGAADR